MKERQTGRTIDGKVTKNDRSSFRRRTRRSFERHNLRDSREPDRRYTTCNGGKAENELLAEEGEGQKKESAEKSEKVQPERLDRGKQP